MILPPFSSFENLVLFNIVIVSCSINQVVSSVKLLNAPFTATPPTPKILIRSPNVPTYCPPSR